MIVIASLARLGSLAIAPVRAVQAITRKLRHRAEVRALAELSDHQLRDVGLTRTEVAGALAGDWLGDPSLMLGARSAERDALVALHRRSEDRTFGMRPVSPAATAITTVAVTPVGALRVAMV